MDNRLTHVVQMDASKSFYSELINGPDFYYTEFLQQIFQAHSQTKSGILPLLPQAVPGLHSRSEDEELSVQDTPLWQHRAIIQGEHSRSPNSRNSPNTKKYFSNRQGIQR